MITDAHKRNKLNNQGYTLVEVMIAVGIFAIGFLAVGSMQINALNTTTSARKTTEALEFVQAQAERLMSMPFYADSNNFDDDLDGTTDNYDVMPDLAAGTHVDNGAWTGNYTINWTVNDDLPVPAYPADIYIVGQTLTRSKTITLWVTSDSNANDILSRLVVAKVWAADL